MSLFNNFQIRFFQDEYLEMMLPDGLSLSDKQRIFYIHDDLFLTCFVHPKEERDLFFDCGSYISLKKYLASKKINKACLKEWLEVLMDVFESTIQESIIDDVSYVFLDHESHRLHFTKLPVRVPSYQPEKAFQNCLWSLLEEIDFEGDEAWLSKLYMITRQKSFRFASLRHLLNEKEERRRFPFLFKKKKSYEEDFFSAFEVHENSAAYGSPDDLKTSLIKDDLKTQVLMAGFQYGYLENEQKETFFISQSPWLIGRLEICHLRLGFPEVSKKHAQMVIENGRCHLEDLGSTNHTVLNGEVLQANTLHSLKDLDVIEFAGHRFIYHE